MNPYNKLYYFPANIGATKSKKNTNINRKLTISY